MSVRLIFSFDSEDYVTPEAADAELWWAEAMSRHGFTACICVVAELARSLHDRDRGDVLDAWSRHEIAYHTDFHSRHPTPAEYLDSLGWEEGIAEAMAREGKGIQDVETIVGQRPFAFCKPGASWGPQICAAMTRLEIPVFCDSPFIRGDPAQPVWFAGQLLLSYHHHFDGYFEDETDRLTRMKRDFTERLERHDGGYLIMYTHPCRLATADFWDGVNFRNGANPERSDWQPAPLRSAEKIAALKRDFDEFLGWVAGLPGVEITTYRRLYTDYREPVLGYLDRDAALSLLRDSGETPDEGVHDGIAYSPAEVLGLGTALFARDLGKKPVPLRRLLGPSEDPVVLPERIDIDRATFKQALMETDAFMSDTGRIPASVMAGRTAIGPGTLFRALRRIARESIDVAGSEIGAGRVRLDPGPELPVFVNDPQIAGMSFRNTWSVFPEAFEGAGIVRHARRQSWTVKRAVEMKRFMKSKNVMESMP